MKTITREQIYEAFPYKETLWRNSLHNIINKLPLVPVKYKTYDVDEFLEAVIDRGSRAKTPKSKRIYIELVKIATHVKSL